MKMAQNVNPEPEPHSSSVKQNEDFRKQYTDGHAVTQRLRKELMNLMMTQEKGVSAFPDGENLFKWIGTITGPSETAYERLTFKLVLTFPQSYPYSAPNVKFLTPCYHPNVDTNGNICLDILKDKWTALYDVRTILLSIQALLAEPNIDSPLNPAAADMWKKQEMYKKCVADMYQTARD